MSSTSRILMILTSHATLGATGEQTGLWFEELTTPYYTFIDAGAQVDIVSVAGGKIPIDPHSIDTKGKNPPSVERFLQDPAAMDKIEHSEKVDNISPDAYRAVFLPGGHGTMWDTATSPVVAKLLTTAWAKGKIVSAVCHGPAGLVNVQDVNGQPLVAGRTVSAFTDSEEAAAGKTSIVPFLLESRIRQLGAKYVKGPDFQPFAVADGHLITGQNPASSEKVAKLVLQALDAGDR